MEKELTKKLTNLIKSGDKLVQDIEQDIGKIVGAYSDLKETITNIKNTLQKPKDE